MKTEGLSGCCAAMLFVAVSVGAAPVWAEPLAKIDGEARCAVCGMFVAKYPNWVTHIRDSKGHAKVFDGVKDLMAFYFDPGAFGSDGKLAVAEIWVKDYYTLAWLDGRKAFYVVGSDVYGPMGEDFIPFQDQGAAENFLKDHNGSKLLTFSEITREMVKSMRSRYKMQGPMMK